MTNATSLSELFSHDAGKLESVFRNLVAEIPYERKGILFSEMFFFWVLSRPLQPRRILESGRARGQSTLILSLCFPEAEIVSVEYDRDSPDVAIAAERLKDRKNVQQLFGDATKLLPELARPGDVAIVDGPKGYRGLRLAIELLGQGLPQVFVHDTGIGSQERRFITQRLPEAVFSDQPAFASLGHSLDQGIWEDLAQNHRWKPNGAPEDGYGFSLACLPQREGRSYRMVFLQAVVDGLRHRLLKR